MPTRREMLATVGGLGVGLGGPPIRDAANQTEIGYLAFINTIDRPQHVAVSIACDEETIFWQRYDLAPATTVEPDGFALKGDYLVQARTADEIASHRLKSGKRIISVQLNEWGLEVEGMRYSREPRSNRTFGSSRSPQRGERQ